MWRSESRGPRLELGQVFAGSELHPQNESRLDGVTIRYFEDLAGGAAAALRGLDDILAALFYQQVESASSIGPRLVNKLAGGSFEQLHSRTGCGNRAVVGAYHSRSTGRE